MPRYDFRCAECGSVFEETRSFSASDEPAACPRDGARATRLFSPPLELLTYRREPVARTGPVSIPPGALSCHDHGPRPGAETHDAEQSGSSWHARGYETTDEPSHSHGHGHTHDRAPGPSHAH
ncbi:MAG: zinc ribbon domain-containing protein [Chloroflexota bacterium]